MERLAFPTLSGRASSHSSTTRQPLPARTTKQPSQIAVQEVVNSQSPKKSVGYELITDKILKALPIIEINYLTPLFIALLLKGYLRG
jgi:hypothetical protein